MLDEEGLLANGIPTTGFELSNDSSCTMASIDCEMVLTVEGRQLARVSLVNQDYSLLYDSLVKPSAEITDYLTNYSGITPEMLEGVSTTLEDIQNALPGFIGKSTILCGHSIENDLNALGLKHKRIIDTSVIYPHPVNTHKNSLKYLAQKFLHKRIQNVKLR